MARPNAHKRPQSKRAGAQLQPDDKTKPVHSRPASGRTTSLGKKVEKPGTGRQGGPSGQTDAARHDRKHTNK